MQGVLGYLVTDPRVESHSTLINGAGAREERDGRKMISRRTDADANYATCGGKEGRTEGWIRGFRDETHQSGRDRGESKKVSADHRSLSCI